MVKSTPPATHHVQLLTTGSMADSPAWFTSLIHWPAVQRASTREAPTAAMPSSEPPRGMRLPKNRMAKKLAAGMAGMIQTLDRNHPPTWAISADASAASTPMPCTFMPDTPP